MIKSVFIDSIAFVTTGFHKAFKEPNLGNDLAISNL